MIVAGYSIIHHNAEAPSRGDDILSSVACLCLSLSYSNFSGVNLNMLVGLKVDDNPFEAPPHNWIKLTIHRQL